MTLYLLLRVTLGQLSPDGEVYRLRLGRLLALGRVDCSWAIGHASAHLGPAAAQSVRCLGFGRVGRLRLGRLLALGTADCLGAIGRTFAQLGPATDQSGPSLS